MIDVIKERKVQAQRHNENIVENIKK